MHWFGATKHFVQRERMTKRVMLVKSTMQIFKEFFCSNKTLVDSLKYFVLTYSYQLKDILMNKKLCDARNVDPSVKWGSSTHYFWNRLPCYIFCETVQISTNIVPSMIKRVQLALCFGILGDNWTLCQWYSYWHWNTSCQQGRKKFPNWSLMRSSLCSMMSYL